MIAIALGIIVGWLTALFFMRTERELFRSRMMLSQMALQRLNKYVTEVSLEYQPGQPLHDFVEANLKQITYWLGR